MTRDRALPEELTIYVAGELRPRWLQWIDEDGDDACRVDAAAVAQVDAAGLQLLVALDRALVRRDRRLLLSEPSQALREACSALGLGDWLDETTTEEARS